MFIWIFILLQTVTEIAHRHEPDVQVSILSENKETKIKEIEPSEFEKGFQKTMFRFGTGILFFLAFWNGRLHKIEKFLLFDKTS